MAFPRRQAAQIRKASTGTFDRLLEVEHIDPATPMSPEDFCVLIMKGPAIDIASRIRIVNQQIIWKTLYDSLRSIRCRPDSARALITSTCCCRASRRGRRPAQISIIAWWYSAR